MASNSALAIASRSGASRCGRQVTGGPGIVRIWWTVLWRTSWLNSGWPREVPEFGEEVVDQCAATNDLGGESQ
jgi:hypothetical protein